MTLYASFYIQFPPLTIVKSHTVHVFHLQFNNAQSASYAKEKLHGFEYPPGSRLVVKFESGGHQLDSRSSQHNRGGLPPPLPLPVSCAGTRQSVDLVTIVHSLRALNCMFVVVVLLKQFIFKQMDQF